MRVDVRHDCQFCSHSNDSHDPLIGCLYPNCMCGNKYPTPRGKSGAEQELRLKRAAQLAREATKPADPTRGTAYGRKPRQRRIWRVLRWLLASTAGALLAGLLLAGAFLLALAFLVARGA